ncbi:UDP-glucose 4-epimerase [Nonlabens marinus S1-08]|uniref:UDP-glucose 4-epimerase n=1 Tax=Nonlabens marinus S1-08 TaxID=1454201 RepID=W8VXY9_9FLAO|nr:UDP-glucose 4-epimerase [Nonlabens marinus S1-08]
MKNVLVTGAAGFIGSNLCKALCLQGYQVLGMDNLATGFESNLSELRGISNFKFVNADIRDLNSCKEVVADQHIVFHQAALGSVPRSVADPVTTNEVNVSGFLNLLKSCADNDVDRFIYAASSSTYGDSPSLPKVESVIGKPLSPYAITKYVNELYADVFHKTYGIDTIGLRYFNVFGPYQDPGGAYAAVIPAFVKAFMNLEPVYINGDGTYSRDFTFVDNVVQANIRAMEAKNPQSLNQVYNVAFGQRTTILELAEAIKTRLIVKDARIADVPILHRKARAGDVPHSLASIEKARSLLNYDPKFDILQGLDRSIQWYWENL